MSTELENFEAVMAIFDAWPNPENIPILVSQQPFENCETYVRIYMLEGRPVQIGMGGNPSQMNRHPGVLQISIFTPLGQGMDASLHGLTLARELIDLLESATLSGMEFTGGWIAPQRVDEGHYRHDASVGYAWDRLTDVRIIV